MAEDHENDIREEIRNLRKENSDAHRDIFAEVKRQNGRVRKLEQWRSWITGGLALLTLGLILFAAFMNFTP